MIRWISDQLGTAPATSEEIGSNVARVDVRDLVDKHGNSLEAVRQKIQQGAAFLREGRTVIVCCDYGISRSNAVAAGILATAKSISFAEAIEKVMQTTGEREIKLELLDVVRAALGPLEDSESQRGERVLLTGASGFIGRHLMPELLHKVNLVKGIGSEIDLTAGAADLAQCVRGNNITQIVHLANPRIYTSNKAIGDSIAMLRNVLDVCRSVGCRLIYLSGWEVYSGYESTLLFAPETLPLLPKGPYGEAKMLCEQLIAHHRRLYDLDCSIIRSSPVYGRGSDRPKFIYNFANKARIGEPIRTHRYLNGDPALELMHVSDLVTALVNNVTRKPEGDFNLGSGNIYSTTEIAQLLAQTLQSNSEIEFIKIEDRVCNIKMDSSRAHAKLDWVALRAFEEDLPSLINGGDD